MSYLTANGYGVSQARITFPLAGAWHADLYVQRQETITGAVIIGLGGALNLVGTVLTGDVYVQAVYIRVVAGSAGFGAPCTPKFYRGATLGIILADVLGQGGEVLSATADAAARSVVVPTFSVTAATVGANVRSLMSYAPAGTSWRFLPDGTFWIGPETWPAFGEDYQVTDEEPRERRATVGFQVPTLRAGQSFALSSGTVVNANHVETSLGVDGFRALAWWQP